MATVGTLSVDLLANTASFNSNIEKAAAQLNSNAAKMSRSLAAVEQGAKRLGEALRIAEVAVVAREFGELIESNLKYVASIGITAKQVGVTAEQLQVYRFAAQQAGVSQDDLERGLQKLTVSTGKASLGAEKQSKVLTALNLPLKDAEGHSLTTAQRMEQLADRFSKMGDQGQKGAVAVELFSRSGMKMIPILDKGSQGLHDLADQAEKAGLVISDSLIEKAHAAEVAIGRLNLQLKTSIAKEVAENAQSIYGLANALTTLTIKGLSLAANYPRISGALTGLAVGGYLTKNPLGAIAGAAIGYVAGDRAAAGNTDVKFRLSELQPELRRLHELQDQVHKGALSFVPALKDQTTRVAYQTKLLNSAVALSKIGPEEIPASPSLPAFLSPKGAKAKKPKKDPLADADLRFGEELAQIDDEILQVKKSSLTDVDAIANIDREIVTKEISRKDLAIQKEVRDKHITEAQGKQLIAENDILAAAKTQQIDTDAKAEKLRRGNELQLAINDNDLGLLHSQAQLATTGATRLRLGLAILDEEKKQERIKLQETIDLAKLGKATADQAAAAQDALNKLDKQFALQAESQRQQNAGPLEAYLRDLHRTPEQLNQAIGQIKVDGLTALTDGLVDAIVNFRSLADVAQNVVKTVLSELLKLEIEKHITGPLAKLLFPQEAAKGADLAASAAALTGSGSVLTAASTALSASAAAWAATATQIQLAASSLLASGGMTSGGGGLPSLLSSLTGGLFGSAGGAASADVGGDLVDSLFAGIPGFASGTDSAPGGWSIIGEEGPELMHVPRGAQIIPNHKFAGMAANNNGGAPTYNIAMHFPNVTNSREARETSSQAARGLRRELNGPLRNAS